MSDENVVREGGPQMAALRRVLYAVGDVEADASILEAAVATAERFEQLETELEELRSVVDTDMGEVSYEKMTKRDKVRIIRSKLVEEAEQSATGKTAMDYQDVRWLFNGRPSPGHAYDLMAMAAESSGFNYEENPQGQNNRITVNLDAVNDDAAFHAANKRVSSGGV